MFDITKQTIRVKVSWFLIFRNSALKLLTTLVTTVLRRGNVSSFSCHTHSALYNVYPLALDRTKR